MQGGTGQQLWANLQRQESPLGSPLTDEAYFCLQAMLLSFAILASDKSAFCKIQLSIYNMPSIQKEKLGDAPTPPYPGGKKALAHVNMVLD